MSDNAIGIVGTDGYTPIYAPDARFCIWCTDEIYLGEIGLNKYIPKINDWVAERLTGSLFLVTDLNNVTYIPELTPIQINTDVVTDQITSSTTDNYRIYYDKSVTPYTLSVDGLMRVYTSEATFARIYLGSFIDPTKIISRRYDNSGNFIGHDVPLDLVAYNSHDNYAIKSIPTCNTNNELLDGETCTVVVFNSAGKVRTRVSCIVDESTYVAQAYAEQKYIVNIFLKSAFVNETQSSEIDYPNNLPVTSFSPIGVVQYNDGSQVEYPVDGDKFTLYGLDQFVSTIIGHKVPLVLKYRMDADEAAIATIAVDNGEVTRPYSLVVSNPNRSYNVKLYVYPVWVDQATGYSYKAFLMNLDRNILYDVTSLISLSSNSASLNPTVYGITQRLTFIVDLAKVSGIYSHYQHVQTVDIILRGPANDSSIPNIWEVSSQVPTSVPYYGTNLRALRDNVTHTKITVGNNIDTTAEFITKLYRTTSPLYNVLTELEAPDPTHIDVTYLGETKRIPIAEYNSPVEFSVPVPLYANVEVVFLKETISGYLKLSVCSLTVR